MVGSVKFFTSSTSLILLLLLSFYSHLHLLLSLTPLGIGYLPQQLVWHVPLNWSKAVSKFLQFTNHHVRVKVTGKRVNRSVGLGLEIPVNYFYGDAWVITWVTNSLENLLMSFRLKKCVKGEHACVFFFPKQS